MNADQYNEIASLFAECVDMHNAAREEFIATRCDGRPSIEAGLRELLAHDRGDHQEDETDLRPMIESAFDQSQSQEPVPTTIAGHQVIREIGRGGMGVVYEAQQTNPQRRVAIKVLYGVATEASRELMKRESSILARMEVPGIARVYESGITEVHGRTTPYLVMELVNGERIDRFVLCDGQQRIDQVQSIELIAKMADAVQQAHRNGVIHRDLKPANILVVKDEQGIGHPVVLDFGVGRVLDAGPHTHTHSTGIVGTLGYLSPEQISGSNNSIDIRSDVYALGAIAFLLLTGEELYDLDGLSVQAALYRIAHESRGHALKRLGQESLQVDGDTALVLAKSLHTDPDQRYQTAAEFALDLRRLNSSEPISARKPSIGYIARKFVKRNTGLTIGSAAAALLLVVVIVSAFIMVNRERDIAVSKAATTEEIAQFLEAMISSASPNELGKDVTVIEAIAQGEAMLDGRFDDEPIVEADLRMILGRTHRALGDEGASLANYEIAHQIYNQVYGAADRRTLYALGRVGVALRNVDRYDEATEAFNKALEIQTEKFGLSDPDTLTTLNSLGIVYARQQRLDESERIAEQVLAAHRQSGKREVPLFTSMHNLARIYRDRGKEDPEKFDQGVELLLEAEEGYRELGELVPALVSQQLRGSILNVQRNFTDAEICLQSGLDESVGALPEDHWLIKVFLVRLGRCYFYAERYEEARVYLEKGLLASDEFFPMHDQAIEMLNSIPMR